MNDLAQENLTLKQLFEDLRKENDILKSELHILKPSKVTKRENFEFMPIEIADFIQEKGLENDLDGLLIDPNDLKIKKQIGSGGFATVYRYYNKKFLIKKVWI